MERSLTKTIKLIATKTYEIAMVELPSGQYCVICEQMGKVVLSESVVDYKTASFLFDIKVQEMEGH